MNETYEPTRLIITEFDKEDVITTSSDNGPDLDPYEGIPLVSNH